MYLLIHLTLIWIVRSLHYYSSALSALADMGLNALSLAAAIWAATQSASVFVSLWCFFLVQALFVAIPTGLNHKTLVGPRGDIGEDPAYRAAQAALRKLSSIH